MSIEDTIKDRITELTTERARLITALAQFDVVIGELSRLLEPIVQTEKAAVTHVETSNDAN